MAQPLFIRYSDSMPLGLENSGQSTSHRGAGKAVVIVDDNAPLRRAVGNAFLENGFSSCNEAQNGEEGIEVIKKVKPDLVILDLSMPVMNGLEAASVLRKLFPKLPIILFSMYGSEPIKSEAAHLGVDAVISKTEDMPTLLDKAHELLHI